MGYALLPIDSCGVRLSTSPSAAPPARVFIPFPFISEPHKGLANILTHQTSSSVTFLSIASRENCIWLYSCDDGMVTEFHEFSHEQPDYGGIESFITRARKKLGPTTLLYNLEN